MNILELAILKKMVGGGGGSGTDNYNDLSNLPQINGETLAGNKTAENLGLQDALTFDSTPTEDSTNPVESGGVYNALAGKQDNLTFDDDPTENSTNPVKSGGVYSALAGKQDNLTFDGVYNASTNKAATESTVTNAIAGLDVSAFSLDADETISSISETDGKVSVAKQDIAIASNQVVAMTGYTKPSSAPATPAIQTSDTANQAFGKLEFKADTNQSNILLVKDATEELVDNGAKNKLDIPNAQTVHGVTFTKNTDDYITSDASTDYSAWSPANSNVSLNLKAGTYCLAMYPHASNTENVSIQAMDSLGTSLANLNDDEDAHEFFTLDDDTVVYIQYKVKTQKARFMLTTKSQYDISPEYEPYALGNQILTPALIEQVDAGSKNKLDCSANILRTLSPNTTNGTWTGNTFTVNNVGSATVNSDNSITVVKTSSTARFVLYLAHNVDPSAISGLILSGCPANGTDSTYSLRVAQISSPYGSRGIDYGNGVEIESSNINLGIYLILNDSYTTEGITFKPMVCTKADWNVSHKVVPYRPSYDAISSVSPFFTVPINHNMIYRGQNLGDIFTDAQDTALSSGNFTDLYLGDYWTKTVTIPAGTYTGGDGEEVTVPAQTDITLKAVIADFDTFYGGYSSNNAVINTHHAAVIVIGFIANQTIYVPWNGTNSTTGGYVNSLIHKWLVGSVLPEVETWFGSAKVLSHQKLLTNAITGDTASGWAWSTQKISLLSEAQLYGTKVWGGKYDTGEAFKHLNVFNHIDANLLFGDKNIWCRDIGSTVGAAILRSTGNPNNNDTSAAWIAPAALILLS